MERIYLSPPHMSGDELELVKEAFASNWIAPVGPHLTAFEEEIADYAGVTAAVALSSGTAALHLGLQLIGVRPGDEVICSSFTFVASANAITYVGARPVFIDADPATWNMDPDLLGSALADRAAAGALPAAIMAVDMCGQVADYERILDIAGTYGVPVIEDAAESLGASYRDQPAGSFGVCAAFSFNGNKIITTSGGGMLVSNDDSLIARARHLSTQAREPGDHYEHVEVGYNYRMSNVLAAIGRGQLQHLDERIKIRREIRAFYKDQLGHLTGLSFMPEAETGESNVWLTSVTIDPDLAGASSRDVRLALERENIESRPLWKPMHMQPVFAGCDVYGGTVSEGLFELGLSLPSGSALSGDQLARIVGIVRGVVPG